MEEDPYYIPPYSTSHAQRHMKIQAARAESAIVRQKDVINSRSSNASGSFTVSCGDTEKLHYSQRVFGVVQPTTIGRNASDHVIRHNRHSACASSLNSRPGDSSDKNNAYAFSNLQKQVALTKKHLYEKKAASHSPQRLHSSAWIPSSVKCDRQSAHATGNSHGLVQGITHCAGTSTSWPDQRSPIRVPHNEDDKYTTASSPGKIDDVDSLAVSITCIPSSGMQSGSLQASKNIAAPLPSYRPVSSSVTANRSPHGKESAGEKLSAVHTAGPRWSVEASPVRMGKADPVSGCIRLHNVVNVTVVPLYDSSLPSASSPSMQRTEATKSGIVILPFGVTTADLIVAVERQFDCNAMEEYLCDLSITLNGDTLSQSWSKGTLGDVPQLSDECTIIGYVKKRPNSSIQHDNARLSTFPLSPVTSLVGTLTPPEDGISTTAPSTLSSSSSTVESYMYMQNDSNVLAVNGRHRIDDSRISSIVNNQDGNGSPYACFKGPDPLVERPHVGHAGYHGSMPASTSHMPHNRSVALVSDGVSAGQKAHMLAASPFPPWHPLSLSLTSTDVAGTTGVNSRPRSVDKDTRIRSHSHTLTSEASIPVYSSYSDGQQIAYIQDASEVDDGDVHSRSGSLYIVPAASSMQEFEAADFVSSDVSLHGISLNESCSTGYEVCSPVLQLPASGNVCIAQLDMPSANVPVHSFCTTQQRCLLEQRPSLPLPSEDEAQAEQAGAPKGIAPSPSSSQQPNRHLHFNRHFVTRHREVDCTDDLTAVGSHASESEDSAIARSRDNSHGCTSLTRPIVASTLSPEETAFVGGCAGHVQLADALLTSPISPNSSGSSHEGSDVSTDFDASHAGHMVRSLLHIQSDDESSNDSRSSDAVFIHKVVQPVTTSDATPSKESSGKDEKPVVLVPLRAPRVSVVEIDITSLLI